MKKLYIVLVVILFSSTSYPQSGWHKVYEQTSGKIISAIQFTSANTGYAASYNPAAEPSQILKTTNGGLNWQTIPFSYYYLGAMCFLDDYTGFVSAQPTVSAVNSFILKTTNGGINWVVKDSMYYIGRIKFFDHNTGFIVAEYSIACKTTNCGENWYQQQSGVQWDTPRDLCCIDADNWLVTSTDNYFTSSTVINKTTNGGLNWTLLDFIGPYGMRFESLSFINNTTGFNAYSGLNQNNPTAIYKTTNTGINWTTISSIPAFMELRLIFVNDNTGYLTGGSSTGNICKTTDGGYNWTRQTTNPYIKLYSSYFFNPNSGFVGGENGIIFSTTTGGTSSVNNVSIKVPAKYSLSQNYPNPFNPSTKIKFDVASVKQASLLVTLKVFDVMGREVQTLVNERLNPGTYETTFDGSMLPSGVYFYKLITEGFTETKRMTLIK